MLCRQDCACDEVDQYRVIVRWKALLKMIHRKDQQSFKLFANFVFLEREGGNKYIWGRGWET